jgi:hypothetical protein
VPFIRRFTPPARETAATADSMATSGRDHVIELRAADGREEPR